jgi:membrane-associated phospholipid phosphatase
MLAFGLDLLIFPSEKNRKLAFDFNFLVGFSVIYCGFHTPFDVLAGILFSFLFVFIFEKILSSKT